MPTSSYPEGVEGDIAQPIVVSPPAPPVSSGASSFRGNISSGASFRGNILPVIGNSFRGNIGSGASFRGNIVPVTASSFRGNIGDGYTGGGYIFIEARDGNPDATGPGTWKGGVYIGHGRLTFSCDFSVNVKWVKDGFIGYTNVAIGTGLGISINLKISDIGGCDATWTLCPAPFYYSQFNGPSPFLYSTGPFVFPRYGYHRDPDTGDYVPGNDYDDPVHVFLDSGRVVELSDGEVNTVSGSFSCFIDTDEYKVFSLFNYLDGQGEPIASKSTLAASWAAYQWGYRLAVNTRWGQYQGHQNFPALPGGTYGVGERYLSRKHYGGGSTGTPYWDSPADISGIVYDGVYGSSIQGIPTVPEATAGVLCDGLALHAVSDSSSLPPHARRSYGVDFSKMTFHSGLWRPVPYTGRPAGAPTAALLTVDAGSISAQNVGFTVQAASETPAHVVGRIYRGDDLHPGDVKIQFGNLKQSSGIPTGLDNGSSNFVELTVSGGQIDTYVPQIRSKYLLPGTWIPPRPADRDDYRFNGVYLVPRDAYDATIRILDDYEWNPTVFSHAKSISLTTFRDITGWAAVGGTISGPHLTLHATGNNYKAYSPVPLGLECRNYRYLHVHCTSNVDGPKLQLDMNGSRSLLALTEDGNTFTASQPVKAGANELIFDLCKPKQLAVSLTRTGWDISPDPIFGINECDALIIKGLANGQTLTISEITLELHDAKTPGYVIPEVTGIPVCSEVYWYSPNRPFDGVDCSSDTFTDPDNLLFEIDFDPKDNYTKLYARLLRAYADGKPAADIPHAIGHKSFGFIDENQQYHTWQRVRSNERLMITDFIQNINSQLGLSASAPQNGTPALLYDCSKINAVFLTMDSFTVAAGSGTGGSPTRPPYKKTVTFQPHLPTADLNGAALKCRVSFNAVKNYPGQISGMEYPFLKRVGHVYEGLVVNPYQDSAEDIEVRLGLCHGKTWPLAPPPPVKTDKNGYFRFSYADKGLVHIETSLNGGPLLGHPRATSWIGLPGGTPPGGMPSYDVSETGRHARAFVQAGTIRVGMGVGAVPSNDSWVDQDTGIAELWPVVKWEKRARNPRLWLVSATTGHALRLRYSRDEGATWTMAIAASGTTGTLVETRHGLKYFYYRQSDGGIKGLILDAQLNVVGDEFTVLTSGVDDTSISAAEYEVGGGKWYIGLTYFAGGMLKYRTSRNGMNFSS